MRIVPFKTALNAFAIPVDYGRSSRLPIPKGCINSREHLCSRLSAWYQVCRTSNFWQLNYRWTVPEHRAPTSINTKKLKFVIVPGTLGCTLCEVNLGVGCTLCEVHLGRSTKTSTMLKNSTGALDIATTAGQSSCGLPKALTLPLVWIFLTLSS